MKLSIQIFSTIISLVIATSSTALSTTRSQHYLDQWRQQHHVTSVVVAIKNLNDNNVIQFSSGYITNQNKQTISADRIYGVGSITKTFTAAALLRLQQAGKVKLDASIGRFFPQYPRWKSITIRQLLNMTSGIRNYMDTKQYTKIARSPHPLTTYTLTNLAYQNKDYFKPGTDWKYSNTNYLLAGLIIEKITQQKLSNIFYQWFFQPLKLQHSFFSNTFYPQSVLKQMAHAYVKQQDVTRFNAGLYGSSGSMLMNSDNLMTWAQNLLLNRNILNDDSLKQLQTTVAIRYDKPRPKHTRYGLGIFYTESKQYGPMWWYTGVINGYTSVFIYLPKLQRIMVAQAASWPTNNFAILFPNKALVQHFLSLSARNSF